MPAGFGHDSVRGASWAAAATATPRGEKPRVALPFAMRLLRYSAACAIHAAVFAQTQTAPSASAPATEPSNPRLVATLPAATQPAVPSGEALQAWIAEARGWLRTPASRTLIPAFSPALELHALEFTGPRPQRVWIARLDLRIAGVRSIVTDPVRFDGADAKFETRCATTLEFAQQTGVQLALNTSAFGPGRSRSGLPMDVVGLAASAGRVYSTPHDPYGAMFVGRDGSVALRAPPLEAGPQPWNIVPGFSMLIDDGRFVVTPHQMRDSFGGPNPRTALAADRAGQTLWILTVDGRQAGRATGMTLIELAVLCESLGAWDALNLDGGGSSTLVLESAVGTHEVLNTPVGIGNKPGSLRPVANNLGFFLPGRGCPPRERHGLRAHLVEALHARLTQRAPPPGHGLHYARQPLDQLLRDRAAPQAIVLLLSAFAQFCETPQDGAGAGNWFLGWDASTLAAWVQAWSEQAELAAEPLLRLRLAGWQPDALQLRRGDLLLLPAGVSAQTVHVFWMRDIDARGRSQLWIWPPPTRPGAPGRAGRGAPQSAAIGAASRPADEPERPTPLVVGADVDLADVRGLTWIDE